MLTLPDTLLSPPFLFAICILPPFPAFLDVVYEQSSVPVRALRVCYLRKVRPGPPSLLPCHAAPVSPSGCAHYRSRLVWTHVCTTAVQGRQEGGLPGGEKADRRAGIHALVER